MNGMGRSSTYRSPGNGSQLCGVDLQPRQREAIEIHLSDPSTPATELAHRTGLSFEDVAEMYRLMRRDRALRGFVKSPYYSHRLLYQTGRTIVSDCIADPDYIRRLLRGNMALSRTLEIHATMASCELNCIMCLWSRKSPFNSEEPEWASPGPLDADVWGKVLEQASKLGTRTVIFSGGGEPLLNPSIFALVGKARSLGLRRHMYTNGLGFGRLSRGDWDEAIAMDQIRFSIHSTDPEIYQTIVGKPDKTQAFRTVTEHLSLLMKYRSMRRGKVRVGIGFVLQPHNAHQIEAVASYAHRLGVDFLDLRNDAVRITRPFAEAELALVVAQLKRVRSHFCAGRYGRMNVNFSDELTVLANDDAPLARQAATCRIGLLRPAISPFGTIGLCDLAVEPRFARPELAFGSVVKTAVEQLATALGKADIPTSCCACMPSGRAGNLIMEKLLSDLESGIHFVDQPFAY